MTKWRTFYFSNYFRRMVVLRVYGERRPTVMVQHSDCLNKMNSVDVGYHPPPQHFLWGGATVLVARFRVYILHDSAWQTRLFDVFFPYFLACEFSDSSWWHVRSANNKQTVYWILAASKGWIKRTYRKIMQTWHHITANDLVQIE